MFPKFYLILVKAVFCIKKTRGGGGGGGISSYCVMHNITLNAANTAHCLQILIKFLYRFITGFCL